MNIFLKSNATAAAKAVRAWAEGRTILVELQDGRKVSFPAENYRLLKNATDEDLSKVRIEARGRALRWEELDEDLSIDGILAGRWHP